MSAKLTDLLMAITSAGDEFLGLLKNFQESPDMQNMSLDTVSARYGIAVDSLIDFLQAGDSKNISIDQKTSTQIIELHDAVVTEVSNLKDMYQGSLNSWKLKSPIIQAYLRVDPKALVFTESTNDKTK
jgi:hypothetical protein